MARPEGGERVVRNLTGAMSEDYPIIKVQPEWALEPEDMGTKKKFWYRKPGDGEKDWLFKHPRSNTGEHWAEKIAAEVANVLGIPHATVELAQFEGRRGSASESFVSGDHKLVHGNQIMRWTVAKYDPNLRFGQSDHSFKNIWESFERVFEEREAADRNRRAFAMYLVLDAVIGNTDRHHENWGLLRRRVEERWKGRLAPSFDHASSLGRELLDERRALLLDEERVDRYSAKGRGGIYWKHGMRHGPSPVSLVRRAAEAHPSYFTPMPALVERLRDSLLTEIVERVPRGWMSDLERAFAIELMTCNRDRLMELTQ